MMKSAVLIHTVGWNYEAPVLQLDNTVSICKTEGSVVETLYKKLCEAENLDQGEPYGYQIHVLIDELGHDEIYPYWGGPHSIISLACNVVAIALSHPLGMCRLLMTKDDFKSTWLPSEVIYEMNPSNEDLMSELDREELKSSGRIVMSGGEHKEIDAMSAEKIAKIWGNFSYMSQKYKNSRRLKNAMDYFFYSCRSYYLEHACLNLSIALESLFSPSSNTELAHRISFNLSRFYGSDRNEREQSYNLIKKFYTLRSQISHGASPDHKELHLIVPDVFNLVANVLQKILLDKTLIAQFCENSSFQKMTNDWLFE